MDARARMILPHALVPEAQSLGCLLTSPTGEDGFRLDPIEADPSVPASTMYELIVWGEQWEPAALDAVEKVPTR